MVIISPPSQDEPTDVLTAEEETSASASPELPPVILPNSDVERLDLDDSQSDAASEGPVTPPAQATEFTVPIIVVSSESATEPFVTAAQDAGLETGPSKIQAPLVPSRSNSVSSPAAFAAGDDSVTPSLSQYFMHLVAPHKEIQQTIDRMRPPLGYSITILCYSLTWWLVTKTPSRHIL